MGWAFNPADSMYTIVMRRTWPNLGESRDGQCLPPMLGTCSLPQDRGLGPGMCVSTAAHLLRRHWGRCVFQRQSPKQSGQRDSAWGSCASSTLPAVWSEGHGAQTALLDETGLQLRNHKVAANPGPWCGVVCISYSSKPHSTFVKATRSKSWVGKRHLFG